MSKQWSRGESNPRISEDSARTARGDAHIDAHALRLLDEVINAWPHLSDGARTSIATLAIAAAAESRPSSAHTQTTPCSSDGRSHGRTAVRCEHGRGAGGPSDGCVLPDAGAAAAAEPDAGREAGGAA
jgi:hypothetical protein